MYSMYMSCMHMYIYMYVALMMSMHIHHETKLSKSCIYQLAYEICGPFLSRLAAAAQLMLLKPAFGCV